MFKEKGDLNCPHCGGSDMGVVLKNFIPIEVDKILNCSQCKKDFKVNGEIKYRLTEVERSEEVKFYYIEYDDHHETKYLGYVPLGLDRITFSRIDDTFENINDARLYPIKDLIILIKFVDLLNKLSEEKKYRIMEFSPKIFDPSKVTASETD